MLSSYLANICERSTSQFLFACIMRHAHWNWSSDKCEKSYAMAWKLLFKICSRLCRQLQGARSSFAFFSYAFVVCCVLETSPNSAVDHPDVVCRFMKFDGVETFSWSWQFLLSILLRWDIRLIAILVSLHIQLGALNCTWPHRITFQLRF